MIEWLNSLLQDGLGQANRLIIEGITSAGDDSTSTTNTTSATMDYDEMPGYALAYQMSFMISVAHKARIPSS
jgi:hypothetical protein